MILGRFDNASTKQYQQKFQQWNTTAVFKETTSRKRAAASGKDCGRNGYEGRLS
jgi:hypothetical protein